MRPIRLGLALGLLAGLAAPRGASALSLQDAIVLAQKTSPALGQARAQADAADARLAQARAGRLPTVTVQGETGKGTTDLGGFFGFGRADVSPRSAALEVRQPLFTGGATGAAIDRAQGGRDAALAQVGGARALLAGQTAEAYVAVLSAREILALNQAQVRQMQKIADQSGLRFKGGEIPRSDLAQAQARLAEARAGLARAEGDVARSQARFISVVGVAPDALETLPAPPPIPASLDEAMATAMRNSPNLVSALARSRSAGAGVRYAEADRLPSLAVSAQATTARDQFFPGYRAEGVAVALQGRWTLFSGGLVGARIDEARAGARDADAAVSAARAQVREAVTSAWEDVRTAHALVEAASDQVSAATIALDSVQNEVRVGQKPTVDLLDAEREALAARSAMISARGAAVTAAYRLNALLGGG